MIIQQIKITFLSAILTFSILGCKKKSSEPPKKQKKPVTTPKPAKKTDKKVSHKNSVSNMFQWVVEGNLKLMDGAILSGGGNSKAIYAGDKINAFLYLSGLLVNEGVDAKILIEGPEGTMFQENKNLMKKELVLHKRGILMVDVGTVSSWVEGNYTLKIDISQANGTRSGHFYIPFHLNGISHKSSDKIELLRFHIPKFPKAGSLLSVWGLIKGCVSKKASGLYYSEVTMKYYFTEISEKKPNNVGGTPKFTGKTVDFVSWSGKSYRTALWGNSRIKVPKKPGKYRMFMEIKDTHLKKRVVFGEQIDVRPPNEGIYSITGVDGYQIPKTVWHRKEQGGISFNVSDIKSDSVTIDFAVLGPKGGAFIINKNNKLKVKAGKANILLPFTVPEFAPAGKFSVMLRLHDGQQLNQRKFSFKVSGKPLKLSTNMRVYGVEFSQTAPVFLSKNITSLKTGRKAGISFVVRGFKHKKVPKVTPGGKKVELLNINVKCTLSLSKPQMESPVQTVNIAKINKNVLQGVNIFRINTNWKVKKVPRGRYSIRINCDDNNSKASSQVMRYITLR